MGKDMKLEVVSTLAKGEVTLSIDWYALGSAFAEASSDQQADFLDAVQTGFGDLGGIAAELMQMAYIAEAVRVDARVALRNWLTRMADTLDSPGESPLVSDADAVELANEGARRVFCVRCERGHEGPCRG